MSEALKLAKAIAGGNVFPGGRMEFVNGKLNVYVDGSGGSNSDYEGELWVQGNHYYDNTAFSPANTNGTEITGSYAYSSWIKINLSTGAAEYSETGPAGATFGDNITWRRVSECGGAGSYILC